LLDNIEPDLFFINFGAGALVGELGASSSAGFVASALLLILKLFIKTSTYI